MIRSHVSSLSLPAMLLLAASWSLAGQGPNLVVDAGAKPHEISPLIYGMAYPDEALAAELKLPLSRWGGDATTRYNWMVDGSNSGDDWFFMAGPPGKFTAPAASADAFIQQAMSWHGKALMTIPIIDYVNSVDHTDCTFPVSIYGPQQKVNPYVHPVVNGKQTDAGNGRTPDGKDIVLTKEQILRTHVVNTPELQKAWVAHIVKEFGPGKSGSVFAYELDNEPGGWGNTHRDIHPGPTGHDELVSRSIKYAEAIKTADPSARVAGPGDFVMHYQSEGKPGDGNKEHGGLGQGNYYLQQFRDYEQKHHKRLLDFFDEHYYPADQDGQTPDTIIECTRSLWDPTYVEKNWIGKWAGGAKELIPKFHRWVDQYYPGTKISISEYGWGDQTKPLDAIAETDVLGIFGREKLDMACLWGAPKAGDIGANAFRIYRNFDGKGATFGDQGLDARSEDQGKLSVYAAQRSTDHALTVVIINKTHDELSTEVQLKGFRATKPPRAFRFSASEPKLAAAPIEAKAESGFGATLPALSATIVEFAK